MKKKSPGFTGLCHHYRERRERDSNPRYTQVYTAFRVQRIQPDSAISPLLGLYSDGNYHALYRITTRRTGRIPGNHP